LNQSLIESPSEYFPSFIALSLRSDIQGYDQIKIYSIIVCFYFKTQLNLLPNQVQSLIIEQNKVILSKFNSLQTRNSFCSGANSIDEEGGSLNSVLPSTTNVLQIPTISTKKSTKST